MSALYLSSREGIVLRFCQWERGERGGLRINDSQADEEGSSSAAEKWGRDPYNQISHPITLGFV